jgi:hypothetical protein
MEFELLFDFAGSAGSVEKLDPINVDPEIRKKLIIEPLTKKAVTNTFSSDNFVASDWPIWSDDRSVNPPSSYITSFVRTRDKEDTPNNGAPEGDEEEQAVQLRLRPTSLVFNLTRDGDGPRYWQWRGSVDGFEKPLPIANFPQEQIDRGCTHEDGIITLPEAAPTSPAFFGPFFLDFRHLAKTNSKWRSLLQLDLRLYGYYK